jgi:hypothetical protein
MHIRFGRRYFAMEAVPCLVENNPFWEGLNLEESNGVAINGVTKCDDVSNSVYTFQLVFVAAFFGSVVVFPFHTYSIQDIIRFNLLPRYQVLVLIFIGACTCALFLLCSLDDDIQDYLAYIEGDGWVQHGKRSPMNVAVRMVRESEASVF